MIARRTALAAPLLVLSPTARAQAEWPQRPVTMLAPFVAGGPSDIVERVVAGRMGQTIGQPVAAENRPGANGAVAAQLLARSAPDGHTLMVGSIGVYAINVALRSSLGYDPVRDLSPVTLAVTTPNVLVVNPQHIGATDIAGVVEWLRRNGARASCSTSGVGSSDQLTMELFKLRTQTEATHIAYQGGAAAATALIGGDVHLSFQNLGTVAGHIAGGRLRAIAVTSRERSLVAPDLRTAIEQGLADFEVTSWQAVMAPAGVQGPLLARVHAAVAEALTHAESRARLEQIGLSVVANRPEDYAALQRAEIARWSEVVRAANIRAE